MCKRLLNKVSIVTGAGTVGSGWGNGKAAAVLYAREGAKVFAVDINPEAVAETKALIDGEGGCCSTHVADVSRAADVQAMVAACLEQWGRIDILHNNVGIFDVGAPSETSEEQWDRMFAVNVKSVFLTCRAVLPIMEAQGGGAIIKISALASIRFAGPPAGTYSASKAAVNDSPRTSLSNTPPRAFALIVSYLVISTRHSSSRPSRRCSVKRNIWRS